MFFLRDVSLSGISATIPPNKIDNISLINTYGEKETLKLIESTGVEHRYIVKNETTGDLCFVAAKALLDKLKVDVKDIGALIFVSQTPDYQSPATACILQAKLGLPNTTIAYDVNLGCSGYIYGLFLASMMAKTIKSKVLLLVGDTSSQLIKPGDRGTEFLFGDAGTATLIENKKDKSIYFELGTNGNGAEFIISREPKPQKNPIRGLSAAYVEMKGYEIFGFTLGVVPSLVNNMLKELNLLPSEIDACVYHQANLFIIKNVSKKSQFSPSQIPLSLKDYGNTSSASIPLTLCSQNFIKRSKILMTAFGVGLSWGCVFLDLSETVLLPVITYSEESLK